MIMVNDSFNWLLNLVRWYFENFSIYIHEGFWPLVLFSGGVGFFFWL